MTPEFLSLDDVLEIQRMQIERFGGEHGVRDLGLVDSAVAQAATIFDDSYLHDGLIAMAGAYLFHIVSNHGFVDGNKRAGLASALVFLDLNGLPIRWGTEDLYTLTLGIAKGEVKKPAVIERLAKISQRP